MKIGYVLNSYPMPSHSFIRREMRALERHGVELHRFSMRTERDKLVDPSDHEELERTEIVLEAAGASGLARAVASVAWRAPGLLAGAAAMAVRLGRRSEVGVLRHMIYLAEACYLRGRFEALSIDHAHAHFGTNSTTVALLMHRLGGPGYSFTVHGPEEFDKPGALALDTKIAHCAFAAGVSSFGRSQLCRQADPDDWDKLEVVHCGIDPARFETVAPMPDGPLRLISIGRLAEQKGQVTLLEALARHRAAGGEASLTLVGDGPMRGVVEARIAALGIGDAVHLTGWVTEAEVERLLAASHVLAMPSFAEGLPMVMMEAMASGRPVLGTYIAGIPELVTPETGWLIPAGDVAEMTKTIGRIASLASADLRDMGEAARFRALERHDITSVTHGLKKIFSEHLSKSQVSIDDT